VCGCVCCKPLVDEETGIGCSHAKVGDEPWVNGRSLGVVEGCEGIRLFVNVS
jgi:hypothetical protein